MLPDVPPGPEWLHEIAMVGFDFLSDGGQGWEKDVHELARLLKPEERHRVALCFHGWYDTLGGYSFDAAKKEMKSEWVAMGRTRKVHFTQDEMRRRLKLARDQGFRVLLYFNDGLLQDTGTPDYRPQWDMVNLKGDKRGGWTGPDTWGETFARNPTHPEVRQWYHNYLAALLRSFGPVVDGFVWDETFYVRTGTITLQPQPAYCDQAMLQLVKTLTAQVRAANPQKAFLTSDCIHAEGLAPLNDALPGYALVADGTYQRHRMRAGGVLLRVVPQLAQHAVELRLAFRLAVWPDAMERRALRPAGGNLQRLRRRLRAIGVDQPAARTVSAAVPLAAGAEPRPLSDRRPAEGPAHRPQGGVKRGATCGSESCGRFGFSEHENTSPEWIDRLFGKNAPEEIKTFNRDGIMFIGEKGRVFVNRGGVYGKAADELKRNPLPADAWRAYPSTNHMANFFECVKRRTQPCAPVQIEHRSVTACHLTNISPAPEAEDRLGSGTAADHRRR